MTLPIHIKRSYGQNDVKLFLEDTRLFDNNVIYKGYLNIFRDIHKKQYFKCLASFPNSGELELYTNKYCNIEKNLDITLTFENANSKTIICIKWKWLPTRGFMFDTEQLIVA